MPVLAGKHCKQTVLGGKGSKGPPSQIFALCVYNMPTVSISRLRLHVANHVYRLQTAFWCARVNGGGGLLVWGVPRMNRTSGQPGGWPTAHQAVMSAEPERPPNLYLILSLILGGS